MNGGGNKKIASAQAYIPISEIKDGVVVLNDGSLRSVLMVSSLNFALKSEEEKDAIIYSYQNFLNSLGFPIQIVASSKKLHLTKYISTIKDLAREQQNPLLKLQTDEYANFIEKLLEVSNIMEKRFYVVIPYFPAGVNVEAGLGSMANKKKNTPKGSFEENKKKLMFRTERIVEGLASMGLRCIYLDTKNLLELYYTSYNPDTAENQKIINIDSLESPYVERGGKDGSF